MPSEKWLEQVLRENQCLKEHHTLVPFQASRIPADNPFKYLLVAAGCPPAAILFLSREIDPGYMARTAALIAAIKEKLGETLGSPVLAPCGEGQCEGLSYALFPYCRTLSANPLLWGIQKRLLRPALTEWLLGITQKSVSEPRAGEITARFIAPLNYIAADKHLPEAMRTEAKRALQSIEEQAWHPKFILMHNDFWKGNVLLKGNHAIPLGKNPFVIIDWTGASLKGYAAYDLIRLGLSFALSKKAAAGALARQAAMLSCSLRDMRFYLLAALGAIGQNPGKFPYGNFLELARSCYRYSDILIPLDKRC